MIHSPMQFWSHYHVWSALSLFGMLIIKQWSKHWYSVLLTAWLYCQDSSLIWYNSRRMWFLNLYSKELLIISLQTKTSFHFIQYLKPIELLKTFDAVNVIRFCGSKIHQIVQYNTIIWHQLPIIEEAILEIWPENAAFL